MNLPPPGAEGRHRRSVLAAPAASDCRWHRIAVDGAPTQAFLLKPTDRGYFGVEEGVETRQGERRCGRWLPGTVASERWIRLALFAASWVDQDAGARQA